MAEQRQSEQRQERQSQQQPVQQTPAQQASQAFAESQVEAERLQLDEVDPKRGPVYINTNGDEVDADGKLLSEKNKNQ